MNLITVRAIILSLILHILAFGLLIVSLDLTPAPIAAGKPDVRVIEAVTVDNKRIEQELARLKQIDEARENELLKKQQQLENKLREIERKSATAEQKWQEEEKKLADLKTKQQEEEKKRKAEEHKLAEAKKQQDELEKKRKQEEIKKAEAERNRQEEERKRKEAEEALKQQLAEEQKQLQAARDRQDQGVIDQYVGRIKVAIVKEFNIKDLPPGLSCVFQIRMMADGTVVEARIIRSSGNSVFDSRADSAVKRASPLPVPDDPRIFGKMREIRLTFAP